MCVYVLTELALHHLQRILLKLYSFIYRNMRYDVIKIRNHLN